MLRISVIKLELKFESGDCKMQLQHSSAASFSRRNKIVSKRSRTKMADISNAAAADWTVVGPAQPAARPSRGRGRITSRGGARGQYGERPDASAATDASKDSILSSLSAIPLGPNPPARWRVAAARLLEAGPVEVVDTDNTGPLRPPSPLEAVRRSLEAGTFQLQQKREFLRRRSVRDREQGWRGLTTVFVPHPIARRSPNTAPLLSSQLQLRPPVKLA
jgi:hypothetical protein